MEDEDLETALARLGKSDSGSRSAVFPVPGRLHTQRRKDLIKAASRRTAQKFIRPENAAVVADEMPEEEGDSTHGIIPGDFVFCDLLTQIIKVHGCPRRIDLTTLSLSEANVQVLHGILQLPEQPILTLLASVYFWATNQEIARAVKTRIAPHPRCRVATGRQHTKIMLLDYATRAWVIEGSANLRSSNCVEQITILASRELLEFHRGWIEEFHAAVPSVKKPPKLVPDL